MPNSMIYNTMLDDAANTEDRGVMDYILQGGGAALISGGVGILNSIKSLGNSLGGSFELADEAETIGNILGRDTQDFYQEHKTGVDALGLVASSFVPFGAAMKITKIAATRGFLGSGARVATKLENPDVMLGSKAVRDAARAYKNMDVPTLIRPDIIRAYATPAKLAASEVLIGESLSALINNQNAMLNPESQEYWEAAKSQLLTSISSPITWGATGVDFGIRALRVGGAIKNEYKTAARNIQSQLLNTAMNLETKNIAGGDRAIMLTEMRKAVAEVKLKDIDEDNLELAEKLTKKSLRALDKGIEDAKASLVSGTDTWAGGFLNKLFGEQNFDADYIASLIGGATKIEQVSERTKKKQAGFFKKTVAPTLVVETDGTIDGFYKGLLTALEPHGLSMQEALDLGDDMVLWLSTGKDPIVVGGKVDPGTKGFALATQPSDRATPKGLPNAFIVANFGGGNMGIIPAAMMWNRKLTQVEVDLYNQGRAALGQAQLNKQEQELFTFLHEIHHTKSNQSGHTATVDGMIQMLQGAKPGGMESKFVSELLELSMTARPVLWDNTLKDFGITTKQLLDEVKAGNVTNLWALNKMYTGRTNELLADAGAMLTGVDAQRSAKIAPSIAALFEQHGGLLMPWRRTEAFVDRLTGETRTSVLPGVADVAKKIEYDAKRHVLVVDGEKINRNVDIFKFRENGFLGKDGILNLTHEDFEKQWILASKREFEPGSIPELKSYDLPGIEAALRSDAVDSLVIDGIQMTKEQAKEHLIDEKNSLFRAFMIQGTYNEQEIARILNTNADITRLLTDSATDTDWLQMAARDISEPQWLRMEYENVDVGDVNTVARSMPEVLLKQEHYIKEQQTAAAQVLGEAFDEFDRIKLNAGDVAGVTAADRRTGFLTGLRPDVGSVRETVAYIGKITRDLMQKRTQEVEQTFVGHNQTLGHANAIKERAELSFVESQLHSNWHTLRSTKDGREVLIAKDMADSLEESGIQISLLNHDELAAELGDAFDESSIKVLSKSVGDVMRTHYELYAEQFYKFKSIAKGQNKHFTWREDVLMPVNRDLRQERAYVFVVPSDAMKGTLPRGMLFARDTNELGAKIDALTKEYGNKYKIVDAQDAKNFNKLRGEYERGDAFDDFQFDNALRREFKDVDLTPNLDTDFSSTLERIRLFHQRREERLVRDAVSLKYSSFVEQLNLLDDAYGAANKQSVARGRFDREQDTIFGDTIKVLTAEESQLGAGAQYYKAVSDFLGKNGSVLINYAAGAVAPVGSAYGKLLGKEPGRVRELTMEQLEEINDHLDGLGFNSPYKDLTTAAIASPNIKDQRSFNTLVRTVNAFVSMTTLTMDMAHHIVSVISTPILMLPVLREAKQALKGTENGAKLHGLTHVGVPGTDFAEPTSMKLMMRATSAFWSKEGKEFLQQLRERNLVPDYMMEYREAHDFADLGGTHGLGQIANKVEKLRSVVGKWSGYRFAEDFSRFIVAWSTKEIGALRGLETDELWSVISGNIDKVHAVHRSTQRAQLFNGPIGQAVGLFQSYSFNWMQNFASHIADGNAKTAMIQTALQSTVFGVRSLPGFRALNQEIGESNRFHEDMYTVTNATEEGSMGQYLMYGLGSHILGYPIDFFNRGDMNPRNPLFIPTSPGEIPGVSIVSNIVKNLVGTVDRATTPGVPITDALIHGLAHNGMNRTLQGLGTMIDGAVTSKDASVFIANANYVNNDTAEGISAGAIFARILGSKPLTESVLMDDVFRRKAYQTAAREQVKNVGTELRLALNSTDQALEPSVIDTFVNRYERAGGNVENFNAFMTRQLVEAEETKLRIWRDQMDRDTAARRSYHRMMYERSTTPPWED